MNKGARIALLIAPLLLALGAVSAVSAQDVDLLACLLYPSTSPRDRTRPRMPSSA